MPYPSLEEVKHAGLPELEQWLHGLPPPGWYVIGSADHGTVAAREQQVLVCIMRKYQAINCPRP